MSQKGGSGKTSICVHMSAYAVSCGEKVVIIDLDPQHSAYDWCELRENPVPDVIAALPERLQKIKNAAEANGRHADACGYAAAHEREPRFPQSAPPT